MAGMLHMMGGGRAPYYVRSPWFRELNFDITFQQLAIKPYMMHSSKMFDLNEMLVY